MNRLNPVLAAACICVIGWKLSLLALSPAHAQEPPRSNCVSVSPSEYASAKKQKVLRTRFGSYVWTGRPGRRYHWYCQP